MKQLGLLCAVMAAGCASDDPSVVGDWRVMENAFTGDTVVVGPERIGFRDDGVLLFDGEDAGRYEVEGDRMEIVYTEGEQDLVVTGGFVVTDDRLLLGVSFPEGEVDGAVGTWVGDYSIDGERNQQTIDLGAGGDVTFIDNGDVSSGTWEENEASLRLTFGASSDLWYRLDELGIGDVMLERME